MNDILLRYQQECDRESDINEHLPTLRKYARECHVVSEMGVREMVSTWALLLGVVENRSPLNKTMYCVDLVEPAGLSNAVDLASQNGVNLRYIQQDSATVTFDRPNDLLFIDTWHVYGHLKRELTHHHAAVKKYIIIHDTEIDKEHGESIRQGLDVNAQSQSFGYPVSEIVCGLQKAIDEFLAQHREWVLFEHFKNNNGLTVLKRAP
jgi:hypothetical protein